MGNMSPYNNNPDIKCYSCKWIIVEKRIDEIQLECECTNKNIYTGMTLVKCKLYEEQNNILPKSLFIMENL